jgi:hypothetical protein
VPLVEPAGETTAGKRSLVIDRAAPASVIRGPGVGESGTGLVEALAAGEDAEPELPRVLDLLAPEIDASEERAIAAESTGLAENREPSTDFSVCHVSGVLGRLSRFTRPRKT